MATLLDKFNAERPKVEKPELTDADKVKKLRAEVKKLKADNADLKSELERAEKLMGKFSIQ